MGLPPPPIHCEHRTDGFYAKHTAAESLLGSRHAPDPRVAVPSVSSRLAPVLGRAIKLVDELKT